MELPQLHLNYYSPKLRECHSMQALEVWKRVYSIFAPYIQFHRDCTKQSCCHLARAVIAHQLWMRCYVALKERYGKNYP
jgi:hypothetical protein